jgi:hypothetical protein
VIGRPDRFRGTDNATALEPAQLRTGELSALLRGYWLTLILFVLVGRAANALRAESSASVDATRAGLSIGRIWARITLRDPASH